MEVFIDLDCQKSTIVTITLLFFFKKAVIDMAD